MVRRVSAVGDFVLHVRVYPLRGGSISRENHGREFWRLHVVHSVFPDDGGGTNQTVSGFPAQGGQPESRLGPRLADGEHAYPGGIGKKICGGRSPDGLYESFNDPRYRAGTTMGAADLVAGIRDEDLF